MYNEEKTIMGTWGTVFLNGEEMAECTGLDAKATLKKTDVPMCGTLSSKYKITGWEGKGTLKFNKINSRMAKLIAENLRAGKETVCEIISKLADPAADGTERVKVKGVKFDELPIANWETNKLVQESMPFTFEDFEYLDMI